MKKILLFAFLLPFLSEAQDSDEKYSPLYPLIENARKAQGGLTGTYTIGGTSPDFTSFTHAFDSLASAGVAGPVELLVRPGTYAEQTVLNTIPGASAANPILIRSENSDSASVILTTASSAAAADNYTLLINGADYVTFSRITLERSGTESYSNIVELANEADNIQFIGNRFIGPNAFTTSNTTGTRSGIFSTDVSSHDSLVVRGNLFIDNANGLWVSGNSTSTSTYATGCVVEDNVFQTFYTGLFLLNQQSPIVRNNTITRNNPTSTTDFFGISIRYCIGTSIISNNFINTEKGSYGIRLRSSNGFFVSPGLTYNNFVTIGDGTAGRGISVEENSLHQVIAFNSVNYNQSNTTGRCVEINGSSTGNVRILNNILSNSGGGYTIYVLTSATTGVAESNHNCLHSTGTAIAYWGSATGTFAQWQILSGKDANSVTGDPLYTSATDLHVNSPIADNAGTPVAGIETDIDGEARSLTTPDIGADEYTFSAIAEYNSSPASIYPNPFRTDAIMKINDDKEYVFTLMDIKGREIARTTVKGIYILNRTGLKSGIYIYSLRNENNTWTGKIEITD